MNTQHHDNFFILSSVLLQGYLRIATTDIKSDLDKLVQQKVSNFILVDCIKTVVKFLCIFDVNSYERLFAVNWGCMSEMRVRQFDCTWRALCLETYNRWRDGGCTIVSGI